MGSPAQRLLAGQRVDDELAELGPVEKFTSKITVIDPSVEEGKAELARLQGQVNGLMKLREPFPPERIEKRPQPKWKKAWENQPSQQCSECGGYHPVGHFTIHLDYVGHANATDRLLEVDPWWDWEPMSYTEAGTPLFSDGGLWIRLTVCGVTRIGYGDGSSVKEVIGDAIRNAAMRFGLALDLWSRVDLHEALNRQAPQDRSGRAVTGRSDARGSRADGGDVAAAAPPERPNQAALDALKVVCDKHGYSTQYCIDRFFSDYDIELKDAAEELILAFADILIEESETEPVGDGASGADGPAEQGDAGDPAQDADVAEPAASDDAEPVDGGADDAAGPTDPSKVF